MVILEISPYHRDESSMVLRGGKLVASVEEERYRRVKHWAGFPREAIRACPRVAGLTRKLVNRFAVPRNSRANLLRKAMFMLCSRPRLKLVWGQVKSPSRVGDV